MSLLDISPEIVQQSLARFFRGLEDYTVNERGDVGSWVRVACIKGLCNIIQALLFDAEFLTTKDMHVSISDYLSVEDYHKAIAGILKQGVERLDNVRQCAGEAFTTLLSLSAPDMEGEGTHGGGGWVVADKAAFSIILEASTAVQWADSSWLFQRAVQFLDVERYRCSVLKGLVLSIGSRTGSTVSHIVFKYVASANGVCRGRSNDMLL